MYESFLSQDLPDDVREIFEYLQKASESHLAAFEGNNGNGQGMGNQSLQTNAQGRGNQSANRGKGNQQNTTATSGIGRNGIPQQGTSTRGNTTGRQSFNQSADCILSDI